MSSHLLTSTMIAFVELNYLWKITSSKSFLFSTSIFLPLIQIILHSHSVFWTWRLSLTCTVMWGQLLSLLGTSILILAHWQVLEALGPLIRGVFLSMSLLTETICSYLLMRKYHLVHPSHTILVIDFQQLTTSEQLVIY